MVGHGGASRVPNALEGLAALDGDELAAVEQSLSAKYALAILPDHDFGDAPSPPEEDGVSFSPAPPWAPGTVVTPTVMVVRPSTATARLDAWLDADGAPGFDPADRIYSANALPMIGRQQDQVQVKNHVRCVRGGLR